MSHNKLAELIPQREIGTKAISLQITVYKELQALSDSLNASYTDTVKALLDFYKAQQN
jgi:ribosomal protein RSM22 (predicted rRNA methylase)